MIDIVRWLPPILTVLAATVAVFAANRARRWRIEAERERLRTELLAARDEESAIREDDPWVCCETRTADCPDLACPARVVRDAR